METTTPRVSRQMYDLTWRTVEVTDVKQVNPQYLSITFAGSELQGFASLDANDHFKMLFPLDPEVTPVTPTRGEKGFVYPDDAPEQALRDFTPRAFNAERNELVVDFVLHESGPAANWAAQAKPGQKVGMVGPRGSKIVSHDFDWFLMVGDETAWPSFARRLEELPAGAKAFVFVEVADAASELPYETAADAQVVWVHRNGAPAGTGTALLDALTAADLPEGEYFAWGGGEASIMKGVRRHIVNERGANREYLGFSGHWKRGEGDFDHHTPLDDDE